MFFILFFRRVDLFLLLGLVIPCESSNAPVSTLKVNFITLRIWLNQHCPIYRICMLPFILVLMFLDPELNLFGLFILKCPIYI